MKKGSLVNERFGNLVVVREVEKNKHGQTMYLCQCDCGNSKEILRCSLVTGRTKTCSNCLSDLTGQKIGRLTVIEDMGKNKYRIRLWKVRCECGVEKILQDSNLRRGATQSCGCLQDEVRGQICKTHGDSGSRLYGIWTIMRRRCYDKNLKGYHNYGGRGITVCDEWRKSYESFRDWSLENGYADNLSIDRIDVNGNYDASNCRWATISEQANNKRDSLFFTIGNQTHTLADWCRHYNVGYSTTYMRLKNGMDIVKALTEPVKNGGKK